ncbi:Fc.00g020350.m01.CDS01 [Cosmosporella sp. VM-42]
MKLSIGFSAALASFAAAAQQAAEVYILPPPTAASTSISPSLARLVLLQRIAPIGKGPSIHDIPDGADPEDVVSLMNKFGKTPVQLFEGKDHATPNQLVVMLEGMTEAQIKELGSAFEIQPAFTIANPPSAKAHDKLLKNDFYNAGITNENECSMEEVANPFEKKCWNGKAAVAKYDVSKNPEVMEELLLKFAGLDMLATNGEVETIIVLLPAVPETSSTKQWSDKPQELRRRQAETVMSSLDETAELAAPTSSVPETPIFYPTKKIPSCFNSQDSCSTGTGNCSGHGTCMNKWAKPDGSKGSEVCYTCHCLSTVSGQGGVTHWAGASCSKQDISFQFWLFAGFTLAMVGILYMAIGLLFSVGEEKLPGVIGAGVSRSK